MNELISGFRDVLKAHLAGRADLNELEQELTTCIKQEPDFAPTYSALIEARHRAGHLPEDSYVRLMHAVRSTLQACGALPQQRIDDRTQISSGPASVLTHPAADPDVGTLIRTPRSPTHPSWNNKASPTDSGASTGSSSSSGWSESSLRSEPSGPPPGPGSVIKNRFELVDVIGRGGMGIVFKARDRLKDEAGDRNPYVAIKILGEEFRRHPQAFRALQREARKAQKLAHPNIATVFDFERDGDTVFMHMELLEGESLDRVIRRHDGNGLPVKEALRITQGLCAALSYAHQQGIIHSDFKPANAYLTREGAVKVLDFGIARASKHRGMWTPSAATTLFDPRSLGALTPAYASCEMIEGQDPDPRDDIYGLAVVTYELLTGRHPFRKLSAAHARDAELTPRPIPALSKRQWSALRRALAFNREQRTRSVEHFLAAMFPRRASLLVWSGGIAASIAVLLMVGAGALWSMIALMDRNSVWFDRTASILSALPESIRTTVLTGETRKLVVQGYRARIESAFNPDQGKFNAPEAQRLVSELTGLLPDSRAVNELSHDVADRRSRALKQLRDRFAEDVSKGWLIKAQNPENVAEVLAIVQQIDPRNALLSDGRLTEAYLRESERALKAGDLALARALVDFGRQLDPAETRLADLGTAVDRESQEGPARIANFKQQLKTSLPDSATLSDFEKQLPTLISLAAIATDDPDVESWRDRLQRLLEPKISELLAANALDDAEKLLQQFAQMLQPSFLDRSRVALADARQAQRPANAPEAAEQDAPSVAQIQARISELMRDSRLTSEWNQQLKEQFAKLSTYLPARHPDVVAAKQRVARTYLEAEKAARERLEVSRAAWFLAKAREFAPYLPEIQQEEELLLSARAKVEEITERQRVDAELNGLKQDLIAQAQAHEMAEALDTLKRLKEILDPADPFLLGAQNEIAQAYLDLAEDAEKEGRREDALNLVQRAAELVPESKRVKFLQAQMSKPPAPRGTPSIDETRIALGEEAQEAPAADSANSKAAENQPPADEQPSPPPDAVTRNN